jgi:hypothetical protein
VPRERGAGGRHRTRRPSGREPIVANDPNAPCRADDAAIITPTAIGPVTVDAANAQTTLAPANLATAPAAEGDNATATASVTNPAIVLGGLTINATVLSATASTRAGPASPCRPDRLGSST